MIGTLADVTMTGAAVQFTTTSARVAWVMLTAPTTNAAAVRVGGPEVTTLRGASMGLGGGQFFPPAGNAHIYDLTQFYGYGTAGDKIQITYGS